MSAPTVGAAERTGPGLSTLLVEDEPRRPARIRFPGNLFRAAWALAGLLAVALLALVLTGTLGGVETDIENAVALLPDPVLNVVGGVANVTGAVFPAAALVAVALRRAWLVLGEVAIAATTASLTFQSMELLVRSTTSPEYAATLLGPELIEPTGVASGAYIAAAVATTTITGLVLGRRTQRVFVLGVALFGTYAIASLPLTVLAVVSGALTGWTVANLVLYVLGSPNPRPTVFQIAEGLTAVHLRPVRMRRVNPRDPGVRVYETVTADGRQLRVRVRDRYQHAASVPGRIARRLLVPAIHGGRSRTVRGLSEQEVMVTLAAAASGARVVRFVAATEAGESAVGIAYEDVPGRILADLSPIDDDVLLDAWKQLGIAHDARVTNHRPTLRNVVVDADGRAWLAGWGEGSVASTNQQLRIDTANFLISTALAVGPERAVDVAVRALGTDAVAAALPALQPLALDAETRRQLKHAKGLLSDLRNRALDAVGLSDIQIEELRRLSPRTLVTLLAGTLAVYLVLPQLAELDLEQVVSGADPAWALGAVVLAMLSYAGSAWGIIGFVPIRLPFWRSVQAQFAAAFASLVAPSFLGVMAVNTRFMQRLGVDPAVAVTSLGVNSAANLITNVFWLLILITVGGASTSADVSVPFDVIWLVVAGVVVAAALVLLVRPLRAFVQRQVTAFVNRVGPAMLSLVQQPRQMLMGFGGLTFTILLKALALQASLLAFGQDVDFADTAAVFIIGNSLGLIFPTPGGLGGVEAAMSAALTAVGVNSGVAVLTVLLFRVATFWLPLVPGWFAFTRMQRSGAL